MKSFITIILISLVVATTTRALGCSEAERFGVVTVSPTTFAQGDNVTISTDFTCCYWFDQPPIYTDYHIEVETNNNGHEPAILLARRQPPAGATNDSFTVQIPYAFVFNASYSLILWTTYPVNGSNGSPFYPIGGTVTPVNITGIEGS
ncbi:hypothetical protein NEOLEDRAFT_570881 [Neolentinus lepideus HHB14362 ss-1]|uniref:Uncharacterized protein n=1 Tax=Neolentinus lepideus HHB14362 ss-1 TaxID=1314782 RepID=A0A165R016_9AGAM|nr:hypothetical protein NEOLEDRAFT_570881 [Neolentinus lepideus HHB14362 ss-1]